MGYRELKIRPQRIAIRSLLNNHLITCIDVGRQMPLMTLESLRGLRLLIYRQAIKPTRPSRRYSFNSEIGIRALLDIQNKLIKFDVYDP